MKYKYRTVVSHKPYGVDVDVRRKVKKGKTRKTVQYLKKEIPYGLLWTIRYQKGEKKEKLSRTVEGVALYGIAR